MKLLIFGAGGIVGRAMTAEAAHRGWHFAQKNVERWACTMRSIVPERQSRHFSPALS